MPSGEEMIAKQRARDGAGVGGGCDALRDVAARAVEALEFGLGGRDPHFRLSASEAQEAADAVLALVAARDAERLAAIEAQQRYTVRPGVDPMRPYLSASETGEALMRSDVLAILRGTTDGAPSPLREQIAHAIADARRRRGGALRGTLGDPPTPLDEAIADEVLPLVEARDAERQAAITALRRPPAFDRDASSVRHGYNAALADVLAILRGTTDARKEPTDA